VAIDVYKRIPANIAGGNRQKPAGINLTGVRDENEALPIIDSGLSVDHPSTRRRCTAGVAFFLAPLCHKAPVMLRFCGLDVEPRGLRQIV